MPVQITNKNNNKSDIEKTIDQPPAKETLSPYEELALLATNKEISNTLFEMNKEDWSNLKKMTVLDRPSKNEDLQLSIVILKE